MRKLIILAGLLCAQAQAAPTFFWRMESTTLSSGIDYVESGGDTTPTAGGAPALNATGAMVGTNGLVASAGQNYRFDTSTTVFDRNVGSYAMLLRVTTWSSLARIVMIRGASAADQYSINLSGTDEITFIAGDPDGSNVAATTTAANLATNTIYGVIARWDQPNSLLRIEVYSDPLGTPTLIQGVSNTSGFTAPSALATADRFRVGENGGSGGAVHMDNVFVSKTYAEPFENNFGITDIDNFSSGAASGALLLRRRRN